MKCLKGFIMWILLSTTIFVSCFAVPMPVKRRMVLRLPFVNNGENNVGVFPQQRTFFRMLNGNSKIKKDSSAQKMENFDMPPYMYLNRRH